MQYFLYVAKVYLGSSMTYTGLFLIYSSFMSPIHWYIGGFPGLASILRNYISVSFAFARNWRRRNGLRLISAPETFSTFSPSPFQPQWNWLRARKQRTQRDMYPSLIIYFCYHWLVHINIYHDYFFHMCRSNRTFTLLLKSIRWVFF